MKYHVEFDIDLKRNQYPGKYIALEGIDGCGKTTQVEALARYFEKKRRKVVKTREPRKQESVIGKFIAEILKGNTKVSSIALQYLFTAERAMHYEELIIPSLKEGKVVISDRCFFSAIPYGIVDRMRNTKKYDFDIGKVLFSSQSILSMYHQFVVPDKTFYLRVSVDTGMKRAKAKHEKKEIYETRKQLKNIILGYEWLVKEFPKEMVRINGEGAVEEVTEEILYKLPMLLNENENED